MQFDIRFKLSKFNWLTYFMDQGISYVIEQNLWGYYVKKVGQKSKWSPDHKWYLDYYISNSFEGLSQFPVNTAWLKCIW